MRRLLGWTWTILGLAALAFAAWWYVTPEATAKEESGSRAFQLPVTLGEVETRDVQPRVELTGTIRSAQRAHLGFEASGRVAELTAREGDRVEVGAELARLASRDAELGLEGARAALASAERELDLLSAGERVEEIRRLAAQLEAARAEAELTKLEVDRGEKLRGDKIIAQSELDRRHAANRAADQRRAAAEEVHAKAVAGTRAEDLAIAEARVAEMRSRVSAAEHLLAKTDLFAPWSGALVRRFVAVGDYVASGQAVFEIVDLEHLEVHVEIPGRFASRLVAGARVRLTLPEAPELVIDARLDATIPAADERSRGFRGIVRLGPEREDAGAMRPGMFVRVDILLAEIENAVTVPADAILVGEAGRYVVRCVAVNEGHEAEFVPVRILAEVDGMAAVEGELDSGQAVVLVGADRAFPGARLLVADRSEAGVQQ